MGNSSYNPLILNNTGTSDSYGVNVLDGTFTANAATKVVNRRWQISESVAGGSNLAVTMQYNSGEEAAAFGAGTVTYAGFFDGSVWSRQVATHSGSGPFSVASNSNFTPADLSTGTRYFAAGRDNAFSAAPTKLVVTTINPGLSGGEQHL